MHPVQYLDQGRLACAVLAEQRVYLAAVDAEIDPAQRLHASEAFGDRLRLDDV